MQTEAFSFPRKADYRQRAHCNPLSDAHIAYPLSPAHVNWDEHYPRRSRSRSRLAGGSCGSEVIHPEAAAIYANTKAHPTLYPTDPVDPIVSASHPEFLDIGCGFGRMLFMLSRLYPDKLAFGMEIRDALTDFVALQIRALRNQHATGELEHDYENCSVVRTNAMKFLSNYVPKDSIQKMFMLFPDPHFKKDNWRRRIISPGLLTTYAYHLKWDGGLIYFITDVRDLFVWMKLSCDQHPLFELVHTCAHRTKESQIEIRETALFLAKMTDSALDSKLRSICDCEQTQTDLAYRAMFVTTDEGRKAIRLAQTLYAAVYRRRHHGLIELCQT